MTGMLQHLLLGKAFPVLHRGHCSAKRACKRGCFL